MSCRMASQVWLLESVRHSAEEAQRLEAHAASCAECGAVLSRLRAVRAVLVADEVPPDPWAREQMRRRLLRPRPLQLRASLAMGALAAAAGVLFYLAIGTEERRASPRQERAPAPLRARYQLPADAQVPLARGVARAGPAGAVFEVAPAELETTVFLEQGTLELELPPLLEAERFEVRTVDARINALATRFSVEAAPDGARVSVEQGQVAMWRRGASAPAIISAPPPPAEPPPAAPAAPPSSTAPHKDRQRTLEAARAALSQDAPRAAELARSVLRPGASAELEAAALAVLADAARRRGLLREAERVYAQVRDHPRGAPYAEEAMLQRALLLAELDEAGAALEELARLEARFPSGATAPERAALAAQLHLKRGDAAAAAGAIQRARFEGASSSLERRRVEVARALLEADPRRTLELLRGGLERGAPAGLEREMRALRARAEALLPERR